MPNNASHVTTNIPAALTFSGVPKSAQAQMLAQILAGQYVQPAKPESIVHIAVNDRELSQLEEALRFFAPDCEVLRFSAWDCLPYDRVSPQASVMAERMRTLATLSNVNAEKKPRIVLTTVNAIIQKLPPKKMMTGLAIMLNTGQTIQADAVVSALVMQGYMRAGKAMEPGEFALRGGIIDIMPSGMQEGIRIDLFGDEIESIKTYDPLTQITHGAIEKIELFPVSEVLLNDETSECFREKYRDLFGAVTKDDPLYEAISHKQNYVGMEHWLPLFYKETSTLFDYCEDALISIDSEATTALEERHETIWDYYEARKATQNAKSNKNSFGAGATYNPVPPDISFLMEAGWEHKTSSRERVVLSPFPDANAQANIPAGYRPIMRFIQGNAENTPFDQLRARDDKRTLLACFTEGSRDRLFTMLMERNFHCVNIDTWQDAQSIKGKTIGLAILPLENGFESDDMRILSEQDVLGERIVRTRKKKKTSDVFMAEAANFSEGELVVHKEHGIGRFEGLITVEVSGASHDCLKLIYDGDDKLFLPVENIDMVSRYGMEEEGVSLDKLGGASWQSRKAKLKNRIKIAAEALLKTAAERKIKKTQPIETPAGSYGDFCARFPYSETEDQERSISEVLEDLHSGKPMDRLICGDVGFGKTEVALRAAFVAACNPDNKVQVALIAPTTLLARQHYKNFAERFEGLPVTIRQLSRMVPTKAQKETREGLKNGTVDIVIGTHALLAKNIEFSNLGLVIVDEEQHFGVGQKEKLKQLKQNVHVLTLSATPIPRTLQMALTGVRDLSLITTPPVDRLAIRSFVIPYDPAMLREALLREKHRGGKSFIVCPRIKNIAEIKAQISELVPEVKMAVAHGQMTPATLDGIMNEFYDGKYDVLLSTAIIESGIDIPTANTMIIFNAHMFGLAQLYQLRGRVGRGKIRAYAYFVLPHYKELTKNATRRLEVMQTLDTLGAGFSLASHDMDIRGFGNLVGEEQSGHIREVGVELYQQMLEEAVASLRRGKQESEAETTEEDWSPQINLGISVLIPESYVNDLGLRLGLYRRVADMNDEKNIDSFAAELTDRFGAMPEEVQNLIAVLGLKLLCKKAGIERIDTGPKGAVISFHNDQFANPIALLEHIERNPRSLKARPDQKLVFTHEWKKADEKIAIIRKLILSISNLT